MPNQVRVGVGTTGVGKASSEVDQLKDKFTKLKAEGAKGLGIGIGAAAATAGLGMVEGALGGVVDALGQSVDKAREDEESQTRLRASLAANIPAWDGNTTAIENTLAARMRLGFSDDEQRQSLALIVAATHDSTAALDVQRTAMDLARIKGIDLATASEALVKVEGGQYRALKALGIVLPANATATQALAAVQKVAAGQAEAYANTNTGKLLASQVAVGEAMEKVGYTIMPAVSAATVVVADGIVALADGVATAVQTITPFVDGLVGLVGTLGDVRDRLGEIGQTVPFVAGAFDLMGKAATLPLQPLFFLKDRIDDVVNSGGREMSRAAVEFAKSAEGIADDARESGRIVRQTSGESAGAITDIGTAATDAADKVKKASDKMIDASLRVKANLLKDAQDTVTGYFDVLITQDKLVATEADITKNKRILASSTATKAERHDAQVALHQLGADQAQYLQDLAAAGASGSKLFTKNMATLLARLKNAHGAERREINAEILALEILAAKAYDAAQKVKTATNGGNLSSFGGGRAAGGPVSKGTPYIVGENHPEVFVPESNGYIIPTDPTRPTGGAPMGSSGGGMTFSPTVVIQGLATPSVREQIVRELGPLFAQWLRNNPGYAR